MLPCQSSLPSNFAVANPCAVCTGPSSGVYFGVLSCRACASFFRRSAMEGRQYSCRRERTCPIFIDGMRNCCRACRLRACLEAGMRMDGGKEPPMAGNNAKGSVFHHSSSANEKTEQNVGSTTLASPSSSSGSTPPCSSTTSPLNLLLSLHDLSMPHTLQFAHSLRNMRNGHRALVNLVCTRAMDLEDRELRPITLLQHLQIHRGEISLHWAMLKEHFPQIDELSLEMRVNILKCFSFKVGFMNRAEQTVVHLLSGQHQQTGQIGQQAVVLHPGCVCDLRRIDQFLCSVKGWQEHVRQCKSLMERLLATIVCKYWPLGICPMEYAALVGIQLWNSVDRFRPLSPEQLAKRNQFFVEMHALAAQRLAPDARAVAVRLGRLLGFVQDISAYAWERDEMFTLLKIFMPMPNVPDIWDDLLNGRDPLEPVDGHQRQMALKLTS